MGKIVVTSGQIVTDIDTLACALAYREIEESALVFLPGPLNQSVIPTIKNWDLNFQTKIEEEDYDFVVVDSSDLTVIEKVIDPQKVAEIFDHHYGFEHYWQEKLGPKAHVEPIGSCATLIWEEFEKRKPGKKINVLNANLLYTAIVSNTLNFRGSVTTSRDIRAAKEIKPSTNLPPDWIEKYYQELEAYIYQDPIKAITSDTRERDGFFTGQIELWDSRNFITKYLKEIRKVMEGSGNPNWFFTSPSISEGKNYLYTKNAAVKKRLKKILDITFNGDLGTTKKLWLRKEILKKMVK